MTAIAPIYRIILKNQYYEKVAEFDSWIDLNYARELNGVDTYSFTINSTDPRCELFQLDGMLRIDRKIPGANVAWYQEFIGLHRSDEYRISERGELQYTSVGAGLNDFLARTIINYKEGTIKAEKSAVGETVIKEYVLENCGEEALVEQPYERQVYGVLPDFVVEPSFGSGILWEGSRAFENLLDTIRDIAKLSNLDYAVNFEENLQKFVFRVYPEQFGADRTTIGLDRNTGLNSAGNAPVIFSIESGTLQNIEYVYDRTAESNAVSVLGDGDGATREIQVVSASTVSDSPWNRREVARPQGGFISQMQAAGYEVLNELSAKEMLTYQPLQQPSQLYGKHYFMGDRVTVYFRGNTYHKRITGISNNVSEGKGDQILLTFSDL